MSDGLRSNYLMIEGRVTFSLVSAQKYTWGLRSGGGVYSVPLPWIEPLPVWGEQKKRRHSES